MGLLNGNLSQDQSMMLGLLGMGLVRGDFAGGAGQALQYAAGAGERDLMKQLRQAQIDETRAQATERQEKSALRKLIAEKTNGLLNYGGSYEPGQLGSGSFNAVPTAQGVNPYPAPKPRGIQNAPFGEIVGLHALGGPDLLPAYKYAREGIERKPGTFYEGLNGQREFIPRIPEGAMPTPGGGVRPMEGLTDTIGAIEAAKARAQEQERARLDVVKVWDPVAKREVYMPRSQVAAPQQQPQPMPQPQAVALPPPQPGVTGRFIGDPVKAMADIMQIADPQERANAMAAFTEQAKRTGGFAERGFPAAGPSTDENAAAAGAKTRAESDARAASDRAAGIQKKTDNAGDMVRNLTRARDLLNAGPTASGVGSAVDTALSWVGGSTDSGDRASALDAISGWLTSNVPRMEGPQSNYDVDQYKTMAGRVGERTLPVSQRLAALDEVERIQKKYAKPVGLTFSDPGKEQRYQEWKRSQLK